MTKWLSRSLSTLLLIGAWTAIVIVSEDKALSTQFVMASLGLLWVVIHVLGRELEAVRTRLSELEKE